MREITPLFRAPGHFVTNLELPLDGHENLDHLDDPGREFIPTS